MVESISEGPDIKAANEPQDSVVVQALSHQRWYSQWDAVIDQA